MSSETDGLAGTGVPREYGRLFLVGCCVLALVLTAAVAPLFPSGGVLGAVVDRAMQSESPAGGLDALLPGDEVPDSGGMQADRLADRATSDELGGVSGGLSHPEQSTVGGDITMSDRVELHLDAPEPAYLREGAYDTYTGEGWNRTGGQRRFRGRLDAREGERFVHRVTLQRSSDVLPAAWRPAEVQGVESDTYVTDQRGVVTDESVAAGETYAVLSQRPDVDPATLRDTGRDYPAAVERRYTDLPADVPDRVRERTDDITAGADGPYEEAVAVRDWLEANKAYSLNATHDPEADVADQFLFEMDAGYCQYFATTMAVMLRTQDVPARYVTGYGPAGEQSDEGAFVYRGRNAHAWVEVYFEDAGWVRFDPTPAGGRYEAGRTTAPDDDRPLNVTVSPDPAPGEEVTVTVRRGPAPVPGAVVEFDGEPVGTTDGEGTVAARVPYQSELTVSVTTKSGSTETTRPSRPLVDGPPPVGLAAPSVLGGLSPVGRASADERVSGTDDDAPDGEAAAETYELPTTATVDARGVTEPGETVIVVATVDDVPVREAEVTVNGTAVARTDQRGRARVTLPDAPAVELGVERGPVTGTTTLSLADDGSASDLAVRTDAWLPLAVPGSAVTVETRMGGRPASDALVQVDGRVVGRTDANGTVTASLPLSRSATVTAATDGGHARTTLPLARNLALTGVGLVLGLVVAAVAYRRLGLARLVAAVGRGIRNVRTLVLTALALAARRLGGLGERVRVALGDAWAALREVGSVAELRRLLAASLSSVSARLRDVGGGADVAAAGRRVRRAVADAWRRVLAALGLGDAGDGSRSADVTAAVDGNAAGRTHRELWRAYVASLSVREWETKTPGELARRGIREGLPREQVRTLLAGFRAAEYDDRPPEAFVDRMEAALEAVREDEE